MPRSPSVPPVAEILRRLEARWPDAHCALAHRDPWQLLVATILSAQCTDRRVNLVTPSLFKRWPTPAALAKAPLGEIEKEIRSTGFFRNKAKSIRGSAERIAREYGGAVPRTMEALLTLPGVARKTANVVLGTAYGIPSGVVVDTHVHRVTRRLGLTEQDRPERIEEDLMRLVPRERWIAFGHRAIWHGRGICHARKPDCPACPLRDLCPSVEAGPGIARK